MVLSLPSFEPGGRGTKDPFSRLFGAYRIAGSSQLIAVPVLLRYIERNITDKRINGNRIEVPDYVLSGHQRKLPRAKVGV